jgi:[ribosomal protein S5]-alanine N-acetyltransferase
MKLETLLTERLELRKITPETYHELFSGHDDAVISGVLGLRDAAALEKERAKYAGGIATWNRSFVLFLMLDRGTGTVLGACGFHTWYTEHARAEIGYAMNGEEHQRKGYMREALAAVVDYGFGQMALNRIEAFIAPWNEASIRLVTRLGFQREGLLRGHYCKDGAMEDSAVYGLLRAEFGA